MFTNRLLSRIFLAVSLMNILQSKFGHVFDIHPRVFVMDANACGSADMKALKAAVAEIKASIVEV